MPLSPAQSSRCPRRIWRQVAAGAVAAVVLATGGTTVATGPAHATTADRSTVVLTSPTEGALLVSVCAVRLTADAKAQVGTIDRVEFYVNGEFVGSDARAPYEVDVPPTHRALRGSARHTAFARVVTVSPSTTADSRAVNFGQVPPPPALMVIACPSRAQVPEGGSTTLTFVTVCADTPGLILTVTGDAGISVTPTVSPPGNREHRVTVSAAPGSAGAVARITATADPGGCMPATAVVTVG